MIHLLLAAILIFGSPLTASALGQVTAQSVQAATKPQIGPAWPASKVGVVFLWRNGNRVRHPAIAYDAKGEPVYAYALKAHGHAVFGRNYEMILSGGWFEAEGVGEYLSRATARSGAATIEAWVTPPQTAPQGMCRIVSFSVEHLTQVVGLAQKGSALLVRPPAVGAEWTKVYDLKDASPLHVVVTCNTDSLVVFVNGKQVHKSSIEPALAQSPDIRLTFGDPDTSAWAGRLEGIAVYDRPMDATEVQQNAIAYSQLVTARPKVPQVELRGKLLRRSESRANIEPYTRALALFEYQVDEVLSGNFKDNRVYVYEWTVMQNKLLPMATRPIGESFKMVLEPFDLHPQLESELQRDTLGEDIERVYYDITGQ